MFRLIKSSSDLFLRTTKRFYYCNRRELHLHRFYYAGFLYQTFLRKFLRIYLQCIIILQAYTWSSYAYLNISIFLVFSIKHDVGLISRNTLLVLTCLKLFMTDFEKTYLQSKLLTVGQTLCIIF
jgi:hypothetical protein